MTTEENTGAMPANNPEYEFTSDIEQVQNEKKPFTFR
jgi:hypothetical protein